MVSLAREDASRPQAPPSDSPRIAEAGPGHMIEPHGWAMLGFLEIADYPTIRRLVGKARAERIAGEVADLLTGAVSGVSAYPVSRDRIEYAAHDATRADLGRTAAAIEGMFGDTLDIDGEIVRVAMYGAAAIMPDEIADDIRLVEEAEAAIKDARRERRFVLRDLSGGTPAFDQTTLIRELPRAIAARETFLHYQPKVNVRAQTVTAVEALIRWQHPSRGLILPADFIPAAEEANDIHALTMWTLRQAITDQRRLAAAGHDITVFVNVSGCLISSPEFVRLASRTVAESGAKIGFEITETSVIRDPESAIANLRCFADHGIEIAIDDYGAGLSSLAYLKRLPAQELKIDKMFVLQLTSSNRDPLIVRSTIDLAHALDMRVTAEGVETQASLALLTVMGCDVVQGYLLGRPLTLDALLLYLERDFAEMSGQSDAQRTFIRPASFWKTG